MKRNILVGGAWPYANGSLHIGHIAALLPGDVIARYHRAKGDFVVYVSGSDCHGTPISIRAAKEHVQPREIANTYHKNFKECFDKLNFTYSKYENTMLPFHEKYVSEFFAFLIDNGSLYEREVKQVFCEKCDKFLPDRYVNGICPVCGSDARGDQCDNCSSLLEPENLLNITCAICHDTPTLRPSKQLYLHIVRLKDALRSYVHTHGNWRSNAINESLKYIQSGLQDRAATRDINWGIDVPKAGYEDKRIYVWFEAVLGYLSMTKLYCEENGIDFSEFWQNSFHYYVHGKDNIPFHTIILPSLLMSCGNIHLPDMIISSEYVTLEGKKYQRAKIGLYGYHIYWKIMIRMLFDCFLLQMDQKLRIRIFRGVTSLLSLIVNSWVHTVILLIVHLYSSANTTMIFFITESWKLKFYVKSKCVMTR